MSGWLVWCGTAVRTSDGLYHMLFSRWPERLGHDAWVTHSEIAYATATNPIGPYTFQRVVLGGAGGDAWDANVAHNPTLLEHDGRFYLYYMGNRGNGEYWNNRNHQRIGLAVADHPGGPWKRWDHPILDVTRGSWDGLMTSNPSVTRGPDGRFCMMYKGVSEKGPMPKGGAVVCGVAFADHPAGPFVKYPEPIITNPQNTWAVEDPFIWCEGDRYYCLVKDFQGYFAKSEKAVIVLFESTNGIDWQPTPDPLVLRREIRWDDGTTQRVDALERPQLIIEDGKPTTLLLACALTPERLGSFNLPIEIR